MISNFDGQELYGWLSSNIANTNLLSCGASGLCFKRIVSVGVTQSLCFLTCDDSSPGSMTLYILCRTHGKNLYDFMFRQGSNVAVSILGNIAVEAAGLAYIEIRSAATNLQRDSLWRLFLPVRNRAMSLISNNQLVEMMEMCSVKPFISFLDNAVEAKRLIELCNDSSLINPTRLCYCLANDPAFSLAWESRDSDDTSSQFLFYLGSDDVYLLVTTSTSEARFHIDMIEREKSLVKDKQSSRVIHMIANFLIFFLWSETAKA
jgi:hypothetical protein